MLTRMAMKFDDASETQEGYYLRAEHEHEHEHEKE